MKDPDVEHQVQLPPEVGEPPVPSECGAASPHFKDLIQGGEQRHRGVVAGAVFGAFVGLLMGAVVGAACCWLTGQFNYFERAVCIGALAGTFVGALIGGIERKIRGEFVRPDVATIVCVVLGFLPALLIVLGGLGFVRGFFSLYLLGGAFFVGPMTGLLIGGALDRAFEEGRKKAWAAALLYGAIGIALCAGMMVLIDTLAYGPDPKEVAKETKTLLLSRWNWDPNMRNATIQSVNLTRRDRTTYTGFADVTFAGRRERLYLEVVVDGEMLDVSWSGEPVGE